MILLLNLGEANFLIDLLKDEDKCDVDHTWNIEEEEIIIGIVDLFLFFFWFAVALQLIFEILDDNLCQDYNCHCNDTQYEANDNLEPEGALFSHLLFVLRVRIDCLLCLKCLRLDCLVNKTSH